MEKTRSVSKFHLQVDRTLGLLPPETLQQRGEMRLAHGDLSGIKYFEQALQLDPKNPKLLFNQGLALFEHGDAKLLSLACKRFKAACDLQPDFHEAWYAWGNTLAQLGTKTGQISYFKNAKRKFEKAHLLSDTDFCWDFGKVILAIAKHSGEVSEYKLALDLYEKANQESSEYWIEHGEIALALGRYVSDPAMFARAATSFKSALSDSIASPSGWHSLATALGELASHTNDEEHFLQASECFATAIQLSCSNPDLYLEWALLLCKAKQYKQAIEKCRTAYKMRRGDMRIVAVWAKALANLGLQQDRLDLIKKAEDKIDRASERNESLPEVWEAYGEVCLCLAHYYGDLDTYYNAIDKYSYGIRIDRSRHELWFGHGLATLHAANLENEPTTFKRASYFFKKALDLHICSEYHFHYGNALVNEDDSKETLTYATKHMERALALQPNAAYNKPDWMFRYGCALDQLGSHFETDTHYIRAIEALSQVLHIAPDYPDIHYHLGLTYAHYGDLMSDQELIHTAIHHFRIAYAKDKEVDYVLLDWAITLINFAELFPDHLDSDYFMRDAEYKLVQSIKLGNTHAYYTLACLSSLLHQYERAIYFLEKAYAFKALPPLIELENDDWLEDLRDKDLFREFLDTIVHI